jgi:oxygen-independent coproporphyrinogen III oxidase
MLTGLRKDCLKEPDETEPVPWNNLRCLPSMAAEKGFMYIMKFLTFALPAFMSRHNTAYWLQEPYLGIGPSANSYNRTLETVECSGITV